MEIRDAVYLALLAIASVVLPYLGLQRGKKLDVAAAQSGASTENRAGIEQVLDGYKALIEDLQTVYESQRERLRDQATEITECWKKVRVLEQLLDVSQEETAVLKRKLDSMIAKYGEG